MKKTFRHLLFCLPVALLVGLTGCEPDKQVVEPTPEIFIDDVTATESSVTFTIAPENAAKYTYSIALKGETGENVTIDNGRMKIITKEGLLGDKDYTITATAFSKSDQKSEVKTFDFKTNPAASIAISPAKEIKWDQATVTLTPTNAEKFFYACYPTAKKPAKPNWRGEIGNKAIDVEITFLEPSTAYTIEAYAENSHGQSESKSITFTTPVEPIITLGEVTATTTTAMVNVATTNADGFKYAVYTDRPENVAWITVEATEAKDLNIEKLTPNTLYTLEIFAYSATNGDGNSEIVAFQTADMPTAYITGAATTTMVALTYNFTPDPAKNINGYIYSSDKGTTESLSAFLDNVMAGKDIKKTTKPMKNIGFKDVEPDKTYKFYVVSCTVTEGVYTAIPSTAQAFEIKTPRTDVIDGGTATAEVKETKTDYDNGIVGAELHNFSDNATMCFAGIFESKEITEEDVTAWTLKNLYRIDGMTPRFSTFFLAPDVKVEKSFYFDIAPESDYKFIYVIVDTDSKLSITVHDFKTPKDPRPVYDNTVSVAATKGLIENGIAKIEPGTVVDPENKIQKVYYKLYTGYEDGKKEFAKQIEAGATGENIYEFSTATGATIDAAASKLMYDEAYNVLILPYLGNNTFGKETKLYSIQFPYTGPEGTATVAVKVAGNKLTITPDANCSRFVYNFIFHEDYDDKDDAGRIDAILSYGYWINPAVTTVDDGNLLYGEKGYVGVLAYDKDGKRSAPKYVQVGF